MTDADSANVWQAAMVCDYCGLPVRSSPSPAKDRSRNNSPMSRLPAGERLGEGQNITDSLFSSDPKQSHGNQPRYCCFGCQLAATITADSPESHAQLNRTALQLGLAVFFSMNVMVFTMVLWSWDTYTIAHSANASALKELLRFACLMFATPVVLILGRPLISNVVSQLQNRIITADCLLVVGVFAAFGYSVLSVLTGQEHIYFEVACMILVALALGRWLEAEGKQRAMKSLRSLQNLLPETARVIQPDGATESRPLATVSAGQLIRVLPGERVPLDGTVSDGQSYIDQQLVTGESLAICRSVGERVFGGTANLDGCLDIRVDADVASGIVQRLVDSVREAASRSSRSQKLADRLATIFVPLVFVATGIVFVFHWRTAGAHHALMASMAVALIACPCALAIATPLAIWAALANAAKHGIVFRTSDDLTALAEVDHVCIDKTGTVTTDNPCLAEAAYEDGKRDDARAVALFLSSRTLHPLARILNHHLADEVTKNDHVIGPVTTVAGKGVIAQTASGLENRTNGPNSAILGSTDFCHEHNLRFSPQLQADLDRAVAAGRSIVCVGWHKQVFAVFSFDESLRPGAAAAVEALESLSLKTLLLTGDQSQRANRIASKLGLNAAAQLLPGDKQAIIDRLQAQGHMVAMLGDGLNDAPALGAAHVGIALGCGAEVTRDAADVCLVSVDLALLPWAIALARATRRTIRRNLLWAVAYNTIGIGLAATGHLNPIFAALAMVLSSGFVIGESLRLATLAGPATIEQPARKVTRVDRITSPDRLAAVGAPTP